MKRIKIGDIIQILTSKGVAYGQYTHKNEKYGTLLSIFKNFYPVAPKDFKAIVDDVPQFQSFFPLQSAINQGLLTVVANEPVSPINIQFPIFKQRNVGKSGPCGPWWLWDGVKSEMLDRDLTELEKKYPDLGIISAPLLVERIEKGYRPEMALSE